MTDNQDGDKHCATCRCEKPTGIRIGIANSYNVGGCCFCNRHINANGSVRHRVHVLSRYESGGTIVRLCDDCWDVVRRTM